MFVRSEPRIARSEPRTSKNMPVRVFGLDRDGRPVSVAASTVDVSRSGARLDGVNCWDRPGEIIGVRHGNEKARFRIVWVGKAGSPSELQVGVVCLDSGKNLWAMRSFDDPAALPGGGPQSSLLRMRAPSQPDSRRRQPRYQASGGAQIWAVGAKSPVWTVLHDLSLGGCYLESSMPLPLGTTVDVDIHVAGIQVRARSTVVTRHPMVGMAVAFNEVSPMNRQRLERMLVILAKTQPQV